MNCEALAHDACPCVLADIGHCRCCSLLSGKQFCQCDYPGVCIYEKHRWEEKPTIPTFDHIAAIFPSDSAAGCIIQWSKGNTAHLGDLLTIKQGNLTAEGVVVQSYPEQNLMYLIVTGNLLGFQETREITIKREKNVFGADAVRLHNVAGKSVAILAEPALLPLLNVLANSLQSQGGSIQLLPLRTAWPKAADLFIFISRDSQELVRVLKRAPLLKTISSAFWHVS